MTNQIKNLSKKSSSTNVKKKKVNYDMRKKFCKLYI